jgi:hypothetical protein
MVVGRETEEEGKRSQGLRYPVGMQGMGRTVKWRRMYVELVSPFPRTRCRKTCKIDLWYNASDYLLPLVMRACTYDAPTIDTCEVDLACKLHDRRARPSGSLASRLSLCRFGSRGMSVKGGERLRG